MPTPVRAIVLTGSGKNFTTDWTCPRWVRQQLPGLNAGCGDPRGVPHTKLQTCRARSARSPTAGHQTVASIHGWCISGEVDLISAADIRYASADAKFSVRETKPAIVADVGSLARLCR